MKYWYLFSCLISVLTGCVRTISEKEVLFESFVQDSIPYRIPALVEMKDGDLLALSDFRPCGQDIGFGRVDIHGRVMNSRTGKWRDKFILIEGSGIKGAEDCGYGDAAIVADCESGELLVMMVSGNTVYWHPATTRSNPNRISVMRSSDNAKTWSLDEVTEDVYSLFDSAPDGCVQSCFVASGKIFQSRLIKVGTHYRIYAALTARPNGNRVVYSDDFGRTWSALGDLAQLPAPNGDEAKCEELPDGRLVLSSRASGGRYFNIFSYTDIKSGSGTWDVPAPSGAHVNGCVAVDNACNGEILILPAVRNSDGEDVFLALQSVPFGPSRANVGIYVKEIPEDIASVTSQAFAQDWNMKYQVSQTWSAYSTMICLKNGNLAFFYEESCDANNSGYDMVYKEFTLETITSGLYSTSF